MFFPDELENYDTFKENNPFENGVDIYRGQTRGIKKSFFANLFSSDIDDSMSEMSTRKVVGRFKGRVDVFNQ